MWLDIILIAAVISWLLKLILLGVISIDHGAMAMVLFAALLPFIRKTGLLKNVFRAGITIAGIVIMVIWYGEGDREKMTEVAIGFLALVVAMLGVYNYGSGDTSAKEEIGTLLYRLRGYTKCLTSKIY